MNRQLHKNVPFGHKWTISAPGIAFNNARIKDLFSYKVYGGPHKGGYWIVNCNPKCTYCLLVLKRDTFYVTDGSPMFETIPNIFLRSPTSILKYSLSSFGSLRNQGIC